MANLEHSIDLLRHGETIGAPGFRGSTDDPLSRHGWAQLWAAVEKQGPCWRQIVSSPLQRCAAFAEALGRRYALPVSFDERLREMHFGTWEGRSAETLMADDAATLSRFWRDPMRNTPPEGEPLACFRERVLAAWQDVVGGYCGGRVLLITHGGVIRMVLCHVLQHPVERLLDFEIPHAALRRIGVNPCTGKFAAHADHLSW